MNANKIETIAGILATALMVFGLFFAVFQEPARIDTAQAFQIQTDLDEAMTLYAHNCSVCHGLEGEGIGAMPALNSVALREADPVNLSKIIARGLFGTAMPAWSKEDGGPLSDYQISELVTLIQYGNWQTTRDRVVNLGLAPLVPFSTEADPALLEQVIALPGGEQLARGINLYAQQCVACHGADGQGTGLAPALNAPALREKSVTEIERVIYNGVPGTLMAGWDNVLSADDIAALIFLIQEWDQVPGGAIPAPDTPVPVTAESLALGADLYAQNCSRCHGAEGQGTQRAPALNVKGYLAETNDTALQQIITLGVPGTAMPSWGDRVSAANIQAIVGFIRAWEPTAPEVAEPARSGGGPWWRSGGSSTSGGKGGGPPWQRDSSATSPDALYLPAEGNTTVSVPSEVPASGSPLAETGADTQQVPDPALPHSAGGPPEWAGAGQQYTAALSPGETRAGQQSTAALPPGESRAGLQPAWWEKPDWRIIALLLGGLMFSFSLIGIAAFHLAHLKSSG